MSVYIAFLFSIGICCAIAYILGLFWFSDIRNRRLRSFFHLGIEIFLWTLFNAITMVIDDRYFPVVYTLRMVMVCIVPFGVTWFLLHFTGSPLKDFKWMRTLMIAVPCADIAIMATNPMHYAYFLDYAYPIPARAFLFWAHTVVDFVFILAGFGILVRYIVKNAPPSGAPGSSSDFAVLLDSSTVLLTAVGPNNAPVNVSAGNQLIFYRVPDQHPSV